MIRYRAWTLGVFVMGAVVVTLGLAETLIYTAPGDLVPALQSYWLDIHVTAMTLATGIFFVSAVLGFVYLWVDRYTRRVAAGRAAPGNGIVRRLPGIEQLDRLTYRTIVFGFPVWTFGVIAGAIWADQAWGRYWGWDPVETWAFITWVLYAAFLHARATAGWRGRRAHYVQLLGFASLMRRTRPLAKIMWRTDRAVDRFRESDPTQVSLQSRSRILANASTSSVCPLRGTKFATHSSDRTGPRRAPRGRVGFAVPGGTTAIRSRDTP